jgi:hypothetical protein
LQLDITVTRHIGNRCVERDRLPAAGIDEQELLLDPDSRRFTEISV